MKINLASKRIGAALLGLALCASFAVVAVNKASANEGVGHSQKGDKAGFAAKIEARLGNAFKEFGKQPQVAIGANGKVLVRGAKLIAISGDKLTAEVSWGSYTSRWIVDASDAKFLHRGGDSSNLADLTVGDTISFSGSLDTDASSATVKANVIRDWSTATAKAK